MKNYLKDSIEILKLSGFIDDSDYGKIYTKGEAKDEISYPKGKLSQASESTWRYIVNNPHKYSSETVKEAKALLNRRI